MIREELNKILAKLNEYSSININSLYISLVESRLNKCVESYYYDLNKSYERLQNKRNLYLIKRLNSKEVKWLCQI